MLTCRSGALYWTATRSIGKRFSVTAGSILLPKWLCQRLLGNFHIHAFSCTIVTFWKSQSHTITAATILNTILNNPAQSQPPRLNERNGQILGYYIRYGQLGSETLSKKTIRDTENLQVRPIFMFSRSNNSDGLAGPILKILKMLKCHVLMPQTIISGLIPFSKNNQILKILNCYLMFWCLRQ